MSRARNERLVRPSQEAAEMLVGQVISFSAAGSACEKGSQWQWSLELLQHMRLGLDFDKASSNREDSGRVSKKRIFNTSWRPYLVSRLEAIALRLEASRMAAIPSRLEAIALRLEASRMAAIPSRLEAIALRVEASRCEFLAGLKSAWSFEQL